MLLNFLNIRLIVNGKDIYTLPRNKPIVIPVLETHPKVVATDGFHITRPLELIYQQPGSFRLHVVCAIDNDLLITGLALLLIFSLVGLVSDIALLRFLSFVPIFYFLFFYYINRKDFIQIKKV